MGAYFLKINPLSAASLQSLHRRLISSLSSLHQLHVPDRQSIAKGDLTNTQPTLDETPPSLSTQWDLHLSVTPTFGNRKLPTTSQKWKALRTEILLRDNRTCSSCGYLSPYPNGRYMVVDHIDGDASNNDHSNLRVHCPPCDAIRHCGFSGLHDWVTVSESTMKQVEIVRKTREIFEDTGVIPNPEHIDPSVKPVDISILEVANMMLETPWKDLPSEFHRLRGFFTEHSWGLFRNTMLTGNLPTYVCFLHF
jgi:5-methylcytosine-specific restriction endonuclease McrA